MIKKLIVRNYALIDSLEITFNSGLSVITGETGAGKSIILGALALILDSGPICGILLRSLLSKVFLFCLRFFFDRNDLEYDPVNCIMRREILPSGKSRAFINDTPVSLTQLKELGDALIDIHSQHQNLLLADTRFQLNVIDVLAGNGKILAQYQAEYNSYRKLVHRLEKLKEENSDSKREEDYLRFQLSQLTEASLRCGEQEELEEEQQRLTHASDIKSELYAVHELLSNDESGALMSIKSALTRLQSLVRIYPAASELSERLNSDYIDIKDLASTAGEWEEGLSADPERLNWIENRLDLLYTLQQKHRVHSVDELLSIQGDLNDKLGKIDSFETEIKNLEQDIRKQYEVVKLLADQLTESRKKEADHFAGLLIRKVKPLGMPNLGFEVELLRKTVLDEMGQEQVRFLFSANKNQPLLPVSDVASGGEISRLMLCIKALVANTMALPTIIFDEVDTGVSGEIADKMGDIMCDMSRYMQVISITHLPQVASKGKTHYRVYKSDTEEVTNTHLVLLSQTEREEEIARMLSGASITEAALINARTLLNANKN
ncbi:MAG: DNA repair protein RecN [Barnesiella sp.]